MGQFHIEYVNHPEAKFDVNVGVLERKHIQIDGVVYIGKEANGIDEQAMDVKKAQEFTNKKEIMENILNISQKQAEALGVSRSRLHGIKNRIRNNWDLNLNTPAVRRLITNGIIIEKSMFLSILA